MELVKILKYVEKSFKNKPSFLLLMSDNKEYISNDRVFIENIEENRKTLIKEHKCEKELTELLNSTTLENYNCITDTRYMFDGCKDLTKVSLEFPKLETSNGMFYGCKNLTSVNLDFPKLETATSMFKYCKSLTKVSLNFLKLEIANYMFDGCDSLEKENIKL